MFPNHSDRIGLFLWVGVYSQDPESGSISHYKNPHPLSFHTSKMTGTHQEQLIDHLRVQTQHLPSQHHHQPHHPEGKGSHRTLGSSPGYCRERREVATEHLDELITSDIPGYRNFTRMEPAFFYLIEERITPHLRKSITNFRHPLEVGLKLAVTLRHLSTGESYTSLQYHWRVGRSTICKFVPQVCKAILKEFQQEYLVCPTDPEDWKKIEERFRNRWNVSHSVGSLDGKHIAIKKPKRSGSEYFSTRE